MTFTTQPLPEPIKLKRPRGRPVVLAEAVLDKGSVVAVFVRESSARAYAARLNVLMEKQA